MATCKNMNWKIIIIVIWFKNFLFFPPFLPDDNLKLRQRLPITVHVIISSLFLNFPPFLGNCSLSFLFWGHYFQLCVLRLTYDQVRFPDTMPFFHKKVSWSVGSMKRKVNSFEMYRFNMFVNISDTTQKNNLIN